MVFQHLQAKEYCNNFWYFEEILLLRLCGRDYCMIITKTYVAMIQRI